DFENTPMAQLAKQRDGLEPSETFLNPLALLLADLIASVSCGASIDGAPTGALRVLCDVRCCVQLAALSYKTSGVVSLVGSHSNPIPGRELFDHQQRRIPFA